LKLLAKTRRGGGRRANGADHPPAACVDALDIATLPSAANALNGGDRLSSGDLAADLAPLFKLLADETRLRILQLLSQEKEIHVRALCERLGQSQPAVSHHLALLREAGLIDVRREGKHNFYRLLPAGFRRFLDMLFSNGPPDGRIRFEQYVLSYAPAAVEG